MILRNQLLGLSENDEVKLMVRVRLDGVKGEFTLHLVCDNTIHCFGDDMDEAFRKHLRRILDECPEDGKALGQIKNADQDKNIDSFIEALKRISPSSLSNCSIRKVAKPLLQLNPCIQEDPASKIKENLFSML